MSKPTNETRPGLQLRGLELDVPDTALAAEQSVEIIRAFIADGALAVSINAGPFGDQMQDWGRVLAQLAHHAARAAALNGGTPEHEALSAIRQGFERTFNSAQPSMAGSVPGRVRH